jgi:hypothetical protein
MLQSDLKAESCTLELKYQYDSWAPWYRAVIPDLQELEAGG